MNTLPTNVRITHPLIDALRKQDIEVRVVGGTPRDIAHALMRGRPVPHGGDLDLIIRKDGESLDSFMRLLDTALHGYKVDAVGKRFGVLKVTAPDGTDFDLAVPRTEQSTGAGRADFIVHGEPGLSYEADAARRDLAINAMLLDPETGVIEDYFGGLDDLANGRISAVGDAGERLEEDITRLLRAAGMVARHGFTVSPETKAGMRAKAHLLARLDPEAVFKEFHNPLKPGKTILSGDHTDLAFALLGEVGALEVLFPEFAACIGFDQHNPHHTHTVDVHVLNVLNAATRRYASPEARFAAFLHDLGKPQTFVLRGGRGTFYGHEAVGADIADRICRRLKTPTAFRETVVKVVALHMRPGRSAV